ncbi:Fic family protein [Zoogloea sp.]|uniref:Fic family protein n=1 Tax=Zoogloea sp. TaxID=49181 RepID=UPI0026314E51|nr:Fic family protein [Zoogloea sp.]MDD3354590.1 Fic family protein [Zoogloea sp.]
MEAAFFMVNLAYLQPFEDGDKRTSRRCANLPLLLQNCAHLSFLDVEQSDYALAMMGIYEQQDSSLAVELFAWTYRRSSGKYAVLLESMGGPDLFRQR